jgi:trehalose-phosphatase
MESAHFLKEVSQLMDANTQIERLRQLLKDHQLVVFLDYDGTLTPVSPHPEEAFLTEDMRETVRKLSELVDVIVISGRNQDNVADRVNLSTVHYIGNHGLDIDQPEEEELQVKIAQAKPAIQACREAVFQLFSSVEGVQIEPKKFTTAVHYRNVKEEEQQKVIEMTKSLVQNHPALKIITGKKVLDICPSLNWNKGQAVLWTLSTKYLRSQAVFPLYIGDDITDESAFFALPSHGMAILVGSHGSPTYADYWLKTPSEVKEFLKVLIEILTP